MPKYLVEGRYTSDGLKGLAREDNVSAAALSVVANQSGFVTSKIIVLLTADEMDQAIKKTTTIEFLPPGH